MGQNTSFSSLAVMLVCIFSLFLLPCFKEEAEAREIDRLRRVFQETVSSLQVTDTAYLSWVQQEVVEHFTTLGESSTAHVSQYFVFVDRNPDTQLIMVGFYDRESLAIDVVGWDYTSTGEPSRHGFFITPTGMFEHSTEIIGYRARGIPNESGWLGIGVKGSRVWDFGWQKTGSTQGGHTRTVNIRLHMHATDPVHGEARLGRPDSKGCVRVSGSMNRFLDFYGILDEDYEENPHRAPWLLDPQRETVSYPGRFMIVADSSFMKAGVEHIEQVVFHEIP